MQSSHSCSKNPLKQVIQYGSICGKFVTISAGLLFLALTSCGSSDPDCGSSATQDLIVQIMKDHKDNRLVNYAVNNSKSLQQSAEEAPSVQSLLSQYNNLKKDFDARVEDLKKSGAPDMFEGPIYQLRRTVGVELETLKGNIYLEKENMYKKTKEKVKEAAVYTLDTIRINSKDADTKAVSCVAKLNVQFEGGGAQMEINYKVENTTDGKLYATVYGL